MWGYCGEWGKILHEKSRRFHYSVTCLLERTGKRVTRRRGWVLCSRGKASPCLLASAFFQPCLGASRVAKASFFEGLEMKQYSLQRWAAIFQVIESEASKNPMLYPEGTRREKVEY